MGKIRIKLIKKKRKSKQTRCGSCGAYTSTRGKKKKK